MKFHVVVMYDGYWEGTTNSNVIFVNASGGFDTPQEMFTHLRESLFTALWRDIGGPISLQEFEQCLKNIFVHGIHADLSYLPEYLEELGWFIGWQAWQLLFNRPSDYPIGTMFIDQYGPYRLANLEMNYLEGTL